MALGTPPPWVTSARRPDLTSSPSSPAPSPSLTGLLTSPAIDPQSMITRSRTLYFLSIRDTAAFAERRDGDDDAGREEEEVGLLGDDAGRRQRLNKGKGRADSVPPRWIDTTSEIESTLARARRKIAALEKLHAKHVLPGFKDRSAEEREIEAQTADVTRDLRRLHSLVTSIRATSRAADEQATARNVQRGLAAKVQELSATFRKKQRVYMQQLQGHAIKNKDLLAASGSVPIRGLEAMDELAEDVQASSLAQMPSSSTSAIQRRDHEITQIAQSIAELADLFRDLGGLVVEQGTLLDCVEYNVQQTVVHLHGAEEELKVATRYQRNAGRRRCILLLVLIIVGLVIVLIYKPRGKGIAPPPDVKSEDRVAQPPPVSPPRPPGHRPSRLVHTIHRPRPTKDAAAAS